MIERSKIKANNSKRDRAAKAKKKRRLTMEGLEARQLLAGDIYLPDVDFNSYNGPRNVGAVQALQLNEREPLVSTMLELGFTSVSLDLEGLVSGKLNREI